MDLAQVSDLGLLDKAESVNGGVEDDKNSAHQNSKSYKGSDELSPEN